MPPTTPATIPLTEVDRAAAGADAGPVEVEAVGAPAAAVPVAEVVVAESVAEAEVPDDDDESDTEVPDDDVVVDEPEVEEADELLGVTTYFDMVLPFSPLKVVWAFRVATALRELQK